MLQKYEKLFCVIVVCITLIALAFIARDTIIQAANLLRMPSVSVAMH